MSKRDDIMIRFPYRPDHPTALAVYCSDGRYTGPVEELTRVLGHQRLDTLTIPGGPALLHCWNAGFAESETVREAARFLIESHLITSVVLVAHEGCGYYRNRYPGLSADQVEARQWADLQHAALHLMERFPGVEVRVFHARPDGQGVQFQVPRVLDAPFQIST